jgi:hypothetical protein
VSHCCCCTILRRTHPPVAAVTESYSASCARMACSLRTVPAERGTGWSQHTRQTVGSGEHFPLCDDTISKLCHTDGLGGAGHWKVAECRAQLPLPAALLTLKARTGLPLDVCVSTIITSTASNSRRWIPQWSMTLLYVYRSL